MEQNELVEDMTKKVVEKLKTRNTSVSSGGETNSSQYSDNLPSTMRSNLINYIDHTLLRPDATMAEIDNMCEEAQAYSFYSVCVNSCWVEYCSRRLRRSGVKICSVVGFPLGAMGGRAKGFETRYAIESGAEEIDMVINIGALKSGDLKLVSDDIRWVRRSTRQETILKVIIEVTLLSDEEIILACNIAQEANADLIQTSTGFAHGGATIRDVALIHRTVATKMGVKAAGGIRNYEHATAVIQAGADRLGTSMSVAIVKG